MSCLAGVYACLPLGGLAAFLTALVRAALFILAALLFILAALTRGLLL